MRFINGWLLIYFIYFQGFLYFCLAQTLNESQTNPLLETARGLVEEHCSRAPDDLMPDLTPEDEKICEEGIRTLEQIRKKEPKNIEVLHLLILSYGRRWSLDKGVEMAKKVIEIVPEDYYAYWYVADYGGESLEKKIDYLRKATQLNPNHPSLQGKLAWIILETGGNTQVV